MPDSLIGRRLGHCRLLERIGEGGMGSVYRARHEVLDKDVAVKVLAPAVRQDKDLVQRLLREARLAARIDHPGVVTVQDAGVVDGVPYLIMPYVKGKNLDDVLKERKKLKPAEALAAVKKAARAFAAAHKLGIIHRDVKPGNLIVTTDGQIKVTDFGLALAVAAGDPRLTRADCVVGTPQFMAPEQVTGEAIDARSDIYSLGATLYNLLSGEAPFAGGTALSVAMKHADPAAQPRPIRDLVPDLSAEIAAIVDTMMAKKPADRYPDMDAVIRAIETVQGTARGGASVAEADLRVKLPGTSLKLPRRALWIGGGALAAVLLLVGILVVVPSGASRAASDLQAAVLSAAAASTPEQLAETAQKFQAVVRQYPKTAEAVSAEKFLKDIEKRIAEGKATRAEEEALKALEEAEKLVDAASSPARRKEAAARFREIAAKYPGTHSAALAEDRRKELESPASEGLEGDAARAVREADDFAVKASTPAEYRETADRYRQIVNKYPRTLAARHALAESQKYDRQAAESGKDEPPVSPDAARRAVEARCRALIDLASRDQQGAPNPEQTQARIREMMAFVDPEQTRAPLEKIRIQVSLSFIAGRYRKEGWKLDSYSIDQVTLDSSGRKATVQVRLQTSHALFGKKENKELYNWVYRQGEWYIVLDPQGSPREKDRDRKQPPGEFPGPPRDRDVKQPPP